LEKDRGQLAGRSKYVHLFDNSKQYFVFYFNRRHSVLFEF